MKQNTIEDFVRTHKEELNRYKITPKIVGTEDLQLSTRHDGVCFLISHEPNTEIRTLFGQAEKGEKRSLISFHTVQLPFDEQLSEFEGGHALFLSAIFDEDSNATWVAMNVYKEIKPGDLPVPKRKPLNEVNFEEVEEALDDYFEKLGEAEVDDQEHYIFEAVVTAYYGKDVWDNYINKKLI